MKIVRLPLNGNLHKRDHKEVNKKRFGQIFGGKLLWYFLVSPPGVCVRGPAVRVSAEGVFTTKNSPHRFLIFC